MDPEDADSENHEQASISAAEHRGLLARIATLRAENERLKAIENAAFDFFCAVDVDPDKSPTFRALRDALSVIDSAVFDAGGIEDG